jgi:hypothetical protein
MEVFDKCERECALVCRVPFHGPDRLEASARVRAPATLSADELIPITNTPNDDGLQLPPALDRIRELLERMLVELASRGVRIRSDLVQTQKQQFGALVHG